ncbi:hypothetical protein QVD17_18203 [Tagetes erecta]|uniref:Pentatricopeptide repeat-containing protein n=1 Tax=Tagetes erecta TaxID=13708 RepID=A0AAD8NW27_TARER|nr:hypothetical protein QVD17_18203 [Tagetes erecta]
MFSTTPFNSIISSFFGKQVHTHVVKSMVVDDARKVFGEMPVRNTVCVNALLSGYFDLYGKCGMVINAKQVFNMARFTDVVLWTSMLGVYRRNGHHK